MRKFLVIRDIPVDRNVDTYIHNIAVSLSMDLQLATDGSMVFEALCIFPVFSLAQPLYPGLEGTKLILIEC